MRHHQSLGDLLGDPVAEALDDVGLDTVAKVAEEEGGPFGRTLLFIDRDSRVAPLSIFYLHSYIKVVFLWFRELLGEMFRRVAKTHSVADHFGWPFSEPGKTMSIDSLLSDGCQQKLVFEHLDRPVTHNHHRRVDGEEGDAGRHRGPLELLLVRHVGLDGWKGGGAAKGKHDCAERAEEAFTMISTEPLNNH